MSDTDSNDHEAAPAAEPVTGPIASFLVAEQAGDGDDPDEEDADEPVPIGAVELYADGRVVVTEGDPARLGLLSEAVARLNAKQSIVLKSSTPQEMPGVVGAVSVERGEPGFVDAARTWLETYYGLVLS